MITLNAASVAFESPNSTAAKENNYRIEKSDTEAEDSRFKLTIQRS